MGRVYACSDLHGCYNLWEKIKEYISDDDHIYFLGDAIDRGLNSIKLMLELIYDDRVTYIGGNHEEMMFNALKTYSEDEPFSNNMNLWCYNGGYETYEQYRALSKDEQKKIYTELKNNILNKIYAVYTGNPNSNIILHHSGSDIKNFSHLDTLTRWDRDHIYNKELYVRKDSKKSIILVHGHTPVQSKYFHPEWKNNIKNISIERYCYGQKIDIDLGCFLSRKTCLLDLNTLEPIYFNE